MVLFRILIFNENREKIQDFEWKVATKWFALLISRALAFSSFELRKRRKNICQNQSKKIFSRSEVKLLQMSLKSIFIFKVRRSESGSTEVRKERSEGSISGVNEEGRSLCKGVQVDLLNRERSSSFRPYYWRWVLASERDHTLSKTSPFFVKRKW